MYKLLSGPKKLDALGKEGCDAVSKWKRSLMNYLNWCGSTGKGNGDMQVTNWDSIANRIQNIHHNNNHISTM